MPDIPVSGETDCSTLLVQMRAIVGEVGVFGTLALLHDVFDRNPGQYETYPVIQKELIRFDLELRINVTRADSLIDHEISEELFVERRLTNRLVELPDRV